MIKNGQDLLRVDMPLQPKDTQPKAKQNRKAKWLEKKSELEIPSYQHDPESSGDKKKKKKSVRREGTKRSRDVSSGRGTQGKGGTGNWSGCVRRGMDQRLVELYKATSGKGEGVSFRENHWKNDRGGRQVKKRGQRILGFPYRRSQTPRVYRIHEPGIG